MPPQYNPDSRFLLSLSLQRYQKTLNFLHLVQILQNKLKLQKYPQFGTTKHAHLLRLPFSAFLSSFFTENITRGPSHQLSSTFCGIHQTSLQRLHFNCFNISQLCKHTQEISHIEKKKIPQISMILQNQPIFSQKLCRQTCSMSHSISISSAPTQSLTHFSCGFTPTTSLAK